MNGECVTAKYAVIAENTISVHNTMVDSTTKKYTDIKGTATCEPKVGQCLVDFGFFFKGDYRIIDTDY